MLLFLSLTCFWIETIELRPGVLFDQAEGRLYMSDQEQNILSVDLPTLKVTPLFEGGMLVHKADGKLLVVSERNGNLVAQALDPNSRKAMSSLEIEGLKGKTSSITDSLSKRLRFIVSENSRTIGWSLLTMPNRGAAEQATSLVESGGISFDANFQMANTAMPSQAVSRKRPTLSGPGYSADGLHRMEGSITAPSKVTSQVFKLNDSMPLGKMTTPQRPSRYLVISDRYVLYTQPRWGSRAGQETVIHPAAINIYDLNTGQVIWTRPVLDLKSYETPAP